jgi:hypothetical protein
VVERRVNAVDADRVDCKLLEEWEITCASIRKGKRVDEVRRFSKGIVTALDNSS